MEMGQLALWTFINPEESFPEPLLDLALVGYRRDDKSRELSVKRCPASFLKILSLISLLSILFLFSSCKTINRIEGVWKGTVNTITILETWENSVLVKQYSLNLPMELALKITSASTKRVSGQVCMALAFSEELLAEPGCEMIIRGSFDGHTLIVVCKRTLTTLGHVEHNVQLTLYLDDNALVGMGQYTYLYELTNGTRRSVAETTFEDIILSRSGN